MNNQNGYTVYKHTAPNGKVYIGITMNKPARRWQGGRGYKDHPHFFNAIEKYGWNNIAHEILHTGLTKEEAEAKEIELIALYQSNNREYGYNVANGGNANGKISDETKAKISESLKGHCVTEETREKMREKARLRVGENHPCYGVGKTEEQKRKISESLKGHKHTEETKAKMRGIHSGDKHPMCKPVVCIETGEYFEYTQKAADKYQIQRTNIVSCCAGRRKKAGGYTWRYADEC